MIDRQRLISGLIALGYINAAWQREGWDSALSIMILLLIPLGLIWFPGSISRSAIWRWGRYPFTGPTPPLAIRTLGWIFLLTPLVVIAARWLFAT